ncbi:MAG: 50S ribosomal protein L25 [Candidatus Omnitrophica bacterium]|nr:50S ribosomal protein L25 [Candidatus Omnitrophota bacterium]
MRQEVLLEARVRNELKKNKTAKIRKTGIVPAVVYKKGLGAIPLSLSVKDMEKALHTSAGGNVIINLSVPENGKTANKTVIIKEIQYDPLKGSLLHVDFNEISLTEMLKVGVPVEAKGAAAGIKDGGILEHILWEVEIECLPTQIPEKIEADISGLKIGDSLHVKDLRVPEGVKILNDPELTIMSVKPPLVEKAAEVVPGAEITEPEVIREKKEEKEEEKSPEEKG